ncbi:MFS transporter [Streptomyces yaizuensis]|uniref:MFS transporter n=1 Tax=Streptomyces yaizuensis TaxID=2989713 RepID=A0ABQ5PAY2_9ACTN|nr:MFS transporter [Streptomyces sp. YSPA8]GLF99731.1 MFS transporter [Streptomyces sp. YSPA8]
MSGQSGQVGPEPGRDPAPTPGKRAPAPGPAGAAAGTNRTLALAAMMFAVAMTFIDQTIVAIAAPDITDELGLTTSGIRWVVNAYLLALAACFALGGRLADIFGHRRITLIGTLIFVVASVLCGCVPAGDLAQAWMIVFRAVQGVGAALLFPAALAVVTAVFPVRRRGRALALFFGLSGALTAIGPLIGGVLTAWTWRAIFWVNVPVALIAVVLTVLARIPDTGRRERLDIPGAALAALGMGLSVLGLQQAAEWGWASAATWGCILAGAALLVFFCWYELHVPDQPLIKLRVFRDRAFAVDTAVLFFAMLAFVPLFFFASVYAQVSLGKSPDEAALYLLYFFLGFVLASQAGGRMLDKRGARPPLVAGSVLAAAGFALWAARLTDLSIGAQWPYVVLSGAGIGLLLAPASTDSVNRAIDASYGEVTGITQTVRNYAAAVGLAVYGTVLSRITVDRVTGTLEERGVPDAVAGEAARGIAQAVAGHGGGRGPVAGEGPVGSALRGAGDAIRRDFAEANQWVLYGMALALVAAFLCALAHPGTRVTEAGSGPTPTDG